MSDLSSNCVVPFRQNELIKQSQKVNDKLKVAKLSFEKAYIHNV